MKKLRTQFTDSFQELRSMKTMVAASMLLAITVVLGFYRLQLTDFLRLGFDFLPKELTAMLFGPGVGCVVAALADIISFIIKPVGRFSRTHHQRHAGVCYLWNVPVSEAA